MIVDTSTLVAIVRGEPEADQCMAVMRQASARRISAGNLLEAYMVIDGAGNPALSEELDADIADLHLIVEPVTAEQIRIAREAFRQYGKGSRHPARLNYGDCFAYALARHLDEPLLFVGNDFTHTDIARAL
jgi:ribonuclease VapC